MDLLRAPCYNGVVRVKAVVIHKMEEYIVTSLRFVKNRKKAFVEMTALLNEDYSVRLPALTVELKDPADDVSKTV